MRQQRSVKRADRRGIPFQQNSKINRKKFDELMLKWRKTHLVK